MDQADIWGQSEEHRSPEGQSEEHRSPEDQAGRVEEDGVNTAVDAFLSRTGRKCCFH